MTTPSFRAIYSQEALQANLPELQVWAGHNEQNARYATHPLGRLILLGYSGASDALLTQALDRALHHDDLKPITQLPGSYSAVIMGEGKLTALTDPVGQVPLYYYAEGGQVAVGSCPSLAAQDRRLVPERSNIMASLIIPGASGKLFQESSSFEEVHKLGAGRILHVTGQGVHSESYGAFAQRHDSLNEAAIELRKALTAAVGSRMELGYVSSDLSGVDSSAIAFLLAQMGNGKPDTFFSSRSDTSSGDRPYVQRHLQLNSAFRLHEFISDSSLTTFNYDDFLTMPRMEDLAYAINASPNGWKFLKAYFSFIHGKNGGAVHLTGDGGDEVLGVRLTYLADLLKSGSTAQFLQHSWVHARLQNASPLKLMQDALRHAYAAPNAGFLRIADSLRNPGQHPGSWLTRDTRDQLIDFLHARASQSIPPGDFRIGDHEAVEALRLSGQYATMLKYYAGQANVNVHSPYLDNDVVKAAFSVPAFMRGDPYEFKKILGMALEGIVPAEVLQRRSKGAYDQEVCRAIVQSSAVYHRVLDESRLADMGIIEPQAVRETLTRIDTRPMSKVWALERIMSVEGWLRSLESSQGPSPESMAIAMPSKQNASLGARQTLEPGHVKIPDYIHAVSSDTGALILFNRRTDMYHPLEITRSNILRTIAAAGDARIAAEKMIAMHPNVDPATLRDDVARCLKEFCQLGIVQPATVPYSRELPKTTRTHRLDANEVKKAQRKNASIDIRLHERIIVTAAFILDRIVSRAYPELRHSLLSILQQKWAKRGATSEEANRLLHAAHKTPYLGRVACNEAPYAAALAAAALRQKIAWHLGASFSPLTFHSWIEAEGKPVRAELEGWVAGRFQSFFDDPQ